MGRKKTATPIVTLGDFDNLTVLKSNPLFALWRSEVTLQEFKILDTYLARINSHDPAQREVIFSKGELEKLLEVDRIRKSDLEKRLDHLMSVITLRSRGASSKKKTAFTKIVLFDKAEAEQDENGLWQIKLSASNPAMQYFFNIDNLGYLRYTLRSILNIKSRYSYILFMYLEKNRKLHRTWKIDLQELKEMLDCETVETYAEFKNFNRLLLKRVQKEILEKTECKYTYEPLKKGRTVTAIQFTLETRRNLEEHDPNEIPGQIDLESYLDETKTAQERLKAACGSEFLPEELDSINAVLMANTDFDRLTEPEEMRLKWAAAKYKEFLVAAAIAEKSGKTIKHRYKYFLKMLKDDPYKFVPEQKESKVVITKSAQAFHNFEERDTDYDALILDAIINHGEG